MKISKSTPKLDGKNLHITIILARFNDVLGNKLLLSTQETLTHLGVQSKNLTTLKVPGALEIPLAAQLIAQEQKTNAIICLGIVIKGDTPHFEQVCQESYRGLMEVNLLYGIPIIFGILTVLNEKQAVDRIAENKLHKGKEFAEAAVEMAMLKKTLQHK